MQELQLRSPPLQGLLFQGCSGPQSAIEALVLSKAVQPGLYRGSCLGLSGEQRACDALESPVLGAKPGLRVHSLHWPRRIGLRRV